MVPQLKIVTWANEEVASDALSIHGYEHYQAPDYALAAWYPPRPRRAAAAAAAPEQATQPSPTGRSAEVTRWWAEGDEPLYYIVSSKAGVPFTERRTARLLPAFWGCLMRVGACMLSSVTIPGSTQPVAGYWRAQKRTGMCFWEGACAMGACGRLHKSVQKS